MSPYRLRQIPYLTRTKREPAELVRLMCYINNISDALTRDIFRYRYIDGGSWAQVAIRIGGGNTSEAVRKRHNRYLRRH